MNSLKRELEQRRLMLISESASSIDLQKKCDDIKYVMDEWYTRLQKRGDKEAYVDSIDELSDKIKELKNNAKSNVSAANGILYVPDNAKLISIVGHGLDDIVDDLISYMKSMTKYHDMDMREKDTFTKKPNKIESKMDDFDRDVDNCFVTKKPMSISGYLVMSNELIDSIDDTMSELTNSILELAKSYCTKYLNSINTEEFTKADYVNIESVFRLVRAFFGTIRLYVGKSYGSICTNVQKIHDIFND